MIRLLLLLLLLCCGVWRLHDKCGCEGGWAWMRLHCSRQGMLLQYLVCDACFLCLTWCQAAGSSCLWFLRMR